ncbi:MAG: molybdopterin-dependent oxidoreductase [Acidobacteriota bacterium]
MAFDAGRRTVLREIATWGAVAGLGLTDALVDRVLAQAPCPDPASWGELLGRLPLYGTRPDDTPYGEIVGGTGLDARLFTDLSDLEADRLITPTDRVFVRTAYPASLRSRPGPWTLRVTRLDGTAAAPLPLSAIAARARPMGAHLIECAGNADPRNFGLMSVAEWDGVPLAEVLAVADAGPAHAVLVGGVDEPQESARSIPGASWILPLADLESLGAFLAVRMNGAPLPPDHGAPVRLVVPGWYGCAWIKWVDELRMVGPDAPSTTQMREFARRTHQDGLPALARDYAAPVIEVAATPVRVERRRVDGETIHRVVGIVWGGAAPTRDLLIRFSSRDAWRPLTVCPPPRTHHTWSVWDYRWQPGGPGFYDIALKPADPAVPARRLDLFYYVRRVRVD